MPPGFTKALAERFNNLCQLDVREIENGMEVTRGTINIAPSGYQTQLIKRMDRHGHF